MWKPVNALPYAFGLRVHGIYLIYIQPDFSFFTPNRKANGGIWVRRQIDTGNNDR